MSARAARLEEPGTTIRTEMTAHAQRTGAINLGQGLCGHRRSTRSDLRVAR